MIQHPMIKHFVLNVNPNAQFEWERCSLHNPITAGQPNLANLVAEAIAAETGSYLVSVNIEVSVLDQVPIDQVSNRSIGKVELPSLPSLPEFAELAA
jgi:hypothetical protein